MTNTELLKEKIANSGFKLLYIAEYVGISRQALWSRINNLTPFNQYEIEKMCAVLNITSLREKEAIFFARV